MALPPNTQFKRGPFHEHSPILNDIANVPGWPKVNTGMIKMYVAEVLRKAPVVQHLPFGSLLPYVPRERKEEAGEGVVDGITEVNVQKEKGAVDGVADVNVQKEETRKGVVDGITVNVQKEERRKGAVDGVAEVNVQKEETRAEAVKEVTKVNVVYNTPVVQK